MPPCVGTSQLHLLQYEDRLDRQLQGATVAASLREGLLLDVRPLQARHAADMQPPD
ncbi:hypothetical protein SSBR45G_70340 [Bradyrhizobium sp. SSBR45G]|nr:hypothetical protein SSBR45G_70340 [Bradyrhizobium sp. SSBR45G]GLH89588.1 hypothetical protein SSBR45R_70490 [Bradyrhizobium sp. SSBR45R]